MKINSILSESKDEIIEEILDEIFKNPIPMVIISTTGTNHINDDDIYI